MMKFILKITQMKIRLKQLKIQPKLYNMMKFTQKN